MTFRDFIEQGTQYSVSGLNAGGRAGQSPVSPEGPAKQMPNLNNNPIKSNKIPASPFNPSSQFVTAKIPPGPGPVDPLKTIIKTPASNFLPGSKRPLPSVPIPNKTN